jgi:hypothetical protein
VALLDAFFADYPALLDWRVADGLAAFRAHLGHND